MSEPVFGWADAHADAGALARFFVATVDPSYISHGEVFCGRALDPHTWAPDLSDVVCAEIARIVSEDGGRRVGVVTHEGVTVALAILAIDLHARLPYAVIEDVVVARDARGSGLGKWTLNAFAERLRAEGVRALFLESGAKNARAHAFFAREGFEVVSKGMYRAL